MIPDVREFIDRLKASNPPPPKDVSSISPELDREYREAHEMAVRHMREAVDGIEERFDNLYEAGTDNADAIAKLDQATAIIRRRDLSDTQRVDELAKIF